MKHSLQLVLLAVVMLSTGLTVGHTAILGSSPTATWHQLMNQYADLVAGEHHLEATETAEGALRLAERVFGTETIEYAKALDQLASNRLAIGQFANAKRFYEESTALHQSVLGSSDPALATALVHESQFHLARGHPEQAEPLLRKALAIHKTHITADNPVGLQTVVLLGNALVAQKQTQAAEALFLKAISNRERELGEQHPSVATLQVALANHYFAREQWGKAKRLYRQALATREMILDEGNLLIPTTLLLLERLYTTTGAEFEAQNSYDRAVELISDALDPALLIPTVQDTVQSRKYIRAGSVELEPQDTAHNKPLQMAKSLQRQAMAYFEMDEFATGIALLEQSVKAYHIAFDRNNAQLPVALEKLAELFRLAGWDKRGTEIAIRAQKMRTAQAKAAIENNAIF